MVWEGATKAYKADPYWKYALQVLSRTLLSYYVNK